MKAMRFSRHARPLVDERDTQEAEEQIEVDNLMPVIYPSPSLYARNHRSAVAGTDRT